jgi:imidazole glycerol phosphate synthase glutamine amidotransferase subunit
MKKLVIIDSGSANLNSVYKAVRAANLYAAVSDDPKQISSATALIFPGVGSFGHAALQIRNKGLDQAIIEAVSSRKPFLGICLGMQLLLSGSEEVFGSDQPQAGLDLIPGYSKRFPDHLSVPHVGWNTVKPEKPSLLFSGLEEGAYFYFTHSYYVVPVEQNYILAKTDYGQEFCSAVQNNNLYGVQFHPEKSGSAGLRLISNFGKIIADQH